MEIRVVCGDPDCREEFPVSTEDPKWECPNCGRIIVNRKYPFLTAKLMQASIDRDKTDWREMLEDLTEQIKSEVGKRIEGTEASPDLSFLDEAEEKLKENSDGSNSTWREAYENLFNKERALILELDKDLEK